MSDAMFVFSIFGLLSAIFCFGFIVLATIVLRTNDNTYIRYEDHHKSLTFRVSEKARDSFGDNLIESRKAHKSVP
jgi:hypothetical protein